MGTLGLSIQL